jgi:hypothetical protein
MVYSLAVTISNGINKFTYYIEWSNYMSYTEAEIKMYAILRQPYQCFLACKHKTQKVETMTNLRFLKNIHYLRGFYDAHIGKLKRFPMYSLRKNISSS